MKSQEKSREEACEEQGSCINSGCAWDQVKYGGRFRHADPDRDGRRRKPGVSSIRHSAPFALMGART
jgi:hypothetical protein